MSEALKLLRVHGHYLAFGIALSATIGSLGMSEIFHIAPCVLCWYQRILMYPLVLVVGVGILRRDDFLAHYALPMAGLGWIFALFHSLLQWGIVPEAASPCTALVSCVTKQINYLGFITIPFMSLVAFSLILVFLILHLQKGKHE
jgi:disulfide bond formation protein DsbB